MQKRECSIIRRSKGTEIKERGNKLRYGVSEREKVRERERREKSKERNRRKLERGEGGPYRDAFFQFAKGVTDSLIIRRDRDQFNHRS